jgi:hypothetical protein
MIPCVFKNGNTTMSRKAAIPIKYSSRRVFEVSGMGGGWKAEWRKAEAIKAEILKAEEGGER